jgi:ABC-type polysaccharide/polyol phosphate transport system ATPase subunit
MPVIEAQQLSKRFLLRHNQSVELKVRFLNLLYRDRRESTEEFWALKDVSLRIERGEAVGLVGRNGSGKSTFLKLIAAIHRPTGGRLLVARDARISSMIELGVGFQPELTGSENVFLNAAIHGLTRTEIERIYGAIVDYSGLGHFIDVPIKNYSSGMYMRLGFAIAANLDPDILLLDEIFAVGDADFQQQCVATVKRFMDEGKTLIFVSHSPAAIRSICRRVCVLEQGRLLFDGGVDEGLTFYESTLGQGTRNPAPAPAPTLPGAADANGAAAEEHEDQLGAWRFDFLRSQGLQPSDYVLEIGPAVPPAPHGMIRFLERDHYCGGLREQVDELPQLFDVAIANSMFPALPFNGVARAIATVVRKLKPEGRFYATWFENPDAASFEPIVHPSGVTTYPDRPPYHYSFDLIAQACNAVGATVERVRDSTHPHGESVLVITRDANTH